MRLLALLLAGVASASPAAADDAALARLMQRMSAVPGVVADFEEERTLSLLAEPIVARGTLWFAPPHGMARVTREPVASALLIDGDEMRFRDATGADPIDLSEEPTARSFAQSFVVLFRGDLDALRRDYDVAYEERASGWELSLAPRSALLARAVERIRLSGGGGALREIELIEPDGDRTVTRLTPVRMDRAVTREELHAAFDGTPLP